MGWSGDAVVRGQTICGAIITHYSVKTAVVLSKGNLRREEAVKADLRKELRKDLRRDQINKS